VNKFTASPTVARAPLHPWPSWRYINDFIYLYLLKVPAGTELRLVAFNLRRQDSTHPMFAIDAIRFTDLEGMVDLSDACLSRALIAGTL